MAELSLSLPVKGEEAPGADAKVNAAFSEIQTQFNGKVAAVNLEANAVETAKIKNEAVTTAKVASEAVTGPKLGAETVRILAATKYEEKSITKAEIEAGTEFSASRMVFVNTLSTGLGSPTVGGISVTLPYLVPPGQKLKGTMGSATVTATFLTL